MSDFVAQAVLKTIRISPQKLNLVAARIRGMSVQAALDYLKVCPKRASIDVAKTLTSAIANAENNHGLDVDLLYVKEAFVGKDICLKRFRARARGRGSRILKPFSRLSIKVAERADEKAKEE